MALSVGIVGLPNVGKSTLFNAITNCKADAQNYPFCTIDPNTGIVPIYDERLDVLSKISNTKTIIPATITFVDIAGLVKGASKGEGLGNKFLSHIREVSVIAHVVRCFENENIVHVSGKINPIDDIETINMELILSDLEVAEKMYLNLEKKTKHIKDKDAQDELDLLAKIKECLANDRPIRTLELSDDEQLVMKRMNFLTSKKVIYVANVSDDMLGKENKFVDLVKDYATKHNDDFTVICAEIEGELAGMSKEEKQEYLTELGIKESGLNVIAKKCYSLLGLQTYLTTGEKETRAWTINKGDTAPKAAGVIHTDFERGFIRANVVAYEDFVRLGGFKQAKENGALRQEGRDYIMQDGDIVEFLFNV